MTLSPNSLSRPAHSSLKHAAMEAPKSIKQKIIDMLHRLPDEIDYDRAIEGIYVLQKVEVGLEQARRGEVFGDDEVMPELLAW
jgi:hypothetical protein